MIISNSRRFVFVHIHKTAGTSITRALLPTMRWNDVFCEGGAHGNVNEALYAEKFGLTKHCHAEAVRSAVGESVWRTYHSFAFVRDPYWRLLSLYTWLGKRLQAQRLRRYVRAVDRGNPVWRWPGMSAYLESPDFSAFIRHPQMLENAEGARPMSDWLTDESGLIVDFVGRVERLDEDMSTIAARLGLDGIDVPRANVSGEGRSLADFYRDQSDLDFVHERYRRDFELFGYPRLSHAELTR